MSWDTQDKNCKAFSAVFSGNSVQVDCETVDKNLNNSTRRQQSSLNKPDTKYLTQQTSAINQARKARGIFNIVLCVLQLFPHATGET